jgi:hypothetical protein
VKGIGREGERGIGVEEMEIRRNNKGKGKKGKYE